MRSGTTYLKLFLSILLAGLSIVAFVNLIVDPYGIYGIVDQVGFNKIKPAGHMRMRKAYELRKLAPEGVVLGTSRALAIDPAHRGWDGTIRSRYNLAFPGANMYETLRYLQHAMALRPVRQMVLGLDFFAFNIHSKARKTFDEKRLAISESGKKNPYPVKEILSTLISFSAIQSSIETLCSQPETSAFVRRWFEEPEADIAGRIRREGERAAFLWNEADFIKNLYFPRPEKKFSFEVGGRSTFDYFRTIVCIARQNSIDLRMFISPIHARQCETIRAVGLWPQFEDWKRRLVAVLDEDARTHPGEAPFPLWDFSGYNSVTTEEVPPLGNAEARMHWYKESSHYTKELGNLVLDRVLNYRNPDRDILEDFGVLINVENIESHIARIRRDRTIYQKVYIEDIAEIEGFLEK